MKAAVRPRLQRRRSVESSQPERKKVSGAPWHFCPSEQWYVILNSSKPEFIYGMKLRDLQCSDQDTGVDLRFNLIAAKPGCVCLRDEGMRFYRLREEVMKVVVTLMQASLLYVVVAILTFCTPYRASAQGFSDLQSNLEVSGGYTHVTGDFGVNGFTAGAGLWFNRRVSMNFDYDTAWNTSTLGVLSLTSFAGHTAIKNHLQDFLFGPRVFFPPHKIKSYHFDPFAEFKIGGSHLSEKLQQAALPTQSAAQTTFAWVLGGGADYQFNSQWFGRVGLDFMRTHFADTGQSRLRLVLGIGYTFSPRPTTR
jgi:opacity protein-like surface antigen